MLRTNDKQKIREHYDFVSPYYRTLWGEHLHHGYWTRGDETKEQAQLQLIEHLAAVAHIPSGARILDVGCGFGASSIYLARKFAAEVTGITISPVQVQMATEAAAKERANARFLLMDAEAMHFDRPFDVVWTVESVSHYQDVPCFFASAATLLQPAGTLALIDWFKRGDVKPAASKKIIQPIEKGMLVQLHTVEDYQSWMKASGLEILHTEVMNEHCARTWDICLDIIKDKAFWKLALGQGPEFISYLRAFKAMRAAFASGDFVYALIVARKNYKDRR